MANITAMDVKTLREKTGLGMMDCKKALVEAEGDMEKAIVILREKGLATAAKKESRIAADGLVDIETVGNTTAMVEVNSETDFVAKNATFKEFVKGLLRTIVACKPADMEALKACKFDGTEETVADKLTALIAVISEKLSIRRFVIVEGTVATYIHGMGSTGVIVKFNADDAAIANPAFVEVSKNIALQIAAGSPPSYVNKENVPASVIASEKEIVLAQLAADPKNEKKPQAILEKMVEGKLGKYYEANCLVEQAYVKEDKMTVGQYLAQASKELGGKIAVDSFVLFEKGEGIEKKEENYAEEIAKLAGKQ